MKTKQLLLGIIALNMIGVGVLVYLRRPSHEPVPSDPQSLTATKPLIKKFDLPARPEFQQPAAATSMQLQIAELRNKAFAIAEATNAKLVDNPGALCLLGKLHLRSNDLEGARALWERAIEIDPGFAEPYNDLGHLEEKQGNLAASIKYFEAAIERSPEFLDAYLPLVEALFRETRFAEAAVRIKEFLQRVPNSVAAWNKLGRAYQQLGEFEKAEQSFQHALTIDGNSQEAILGMMTAYRSLGDQTRAAETAKLLAEISKQQPRTSEDRDVVARDREKMQSLLVFTAQTSADLLVRSGDVTTAIAQLNNTLKDAPNSDEIITQLSELHLALGDVDAALKILREAADANAEDPAAWMELALMCIKTRRLDAAENALERLIQLAPDNPLAYNLLAQTQMPSGRNQRAAVVNARRAVELLPSANNHYVLATAHFNLGEIENTKAELKIAIELEPENSEYRAALERIK